MLVAFRFIAGCFGAAPVAIGGAMVYDLFHVDERGAAMAVYHSGPIFGNLLGPPLGGLIIQHNGWRWVFWIITIFVSFLSFLLSLRDPLTLAGWLRFDLLFLHPQGDSCADNCTQIILQSNT